MALTLTYADNGKSIEVREGDEVILVLDENPTTGYRWYIDHANGILELDSDSYHPEPEMRFGSGGVREFRFHSNAPGTARLELKHWQEWEGESSVTKRFSVEIRVTAEGGQER